jgi:hypothetical protein
MSKSISELLASQLAGIFNCAPAAPAPEPEDDPEAILQAAIDAIPAAPEAQSATPLMSGITLPAIVDPQPPRAARRYSGRRRGNGGGRGTFNPNWRKVSEITVEVNPRTGNLEIRFPVKPADVVRQTLHAQGWRFTYTDGCWYHANNERNAAFTRSLKSTVSAY